MNSAVNPLTPSLDLSFFESAYVLLPVETKDIQENDNVVLLDKNSEILQVNGEKLLHVLSASHTNEEEPSTSLTVVPFIPYHTAHKPVQPPFNEPVMDYEKVTTVALKMVDFDPTAHPDWDVSTGTELSQIIGIEEVPLVREYQALLDDIDTIKDKTLTRFPLKVLYRSEPRRVLSEEGSYTSVYINLLTTPYQIPYFQELIKNGYLLYDWRTKSE